MTLSTIFLIIALICFILAAFGVSVPRTNLGWLGLAFVTLSWLIAGGVVLQG